MHDAESKCQFTDRCTCVWPDNDGGLWCNKNGFCVDGRKRKKGTKGKEVGVNEGLIQRCRTASKSFDY